MKSIWELGFKDLVAPGIVKMQSTVHKAFGQIATYESQLQGRINSTTAAVQRQTSSFSGLGSTVMQVLGVGGAIGTVSALGYGVLKVGNNMEQTRTAFNVLLGDVGLANTKLKELQSFADVSPFDNEQTFAAAQSLLGYSVSAEKLLPVMNFLGDASIGNAAKFSQLVDNYGKMNTTQLARTVDLNQFANAGVPIWAELTKITGKSGEALHKWVEQNGVSVGVIDNIFTKLNSKGGMFYDMMKKQSETVAGKWSTMVSKLQVTAIKIFEHLKPFMKSLMDLGTTILPIVENALRGIWNVGVSVNKWIADNVGWLSILSGLLIGGVGAYYLLIGALQIYNGLLIIGRGAQLLYAVTTGLLTGSLSLATIASWGFNASLMANPIMMVVVGIGALIGAVVLAWNHFEGFRKVVYGLWEAFKQVFTNIGAFFKQIFSPIFEAINAFKEGRYVDAAKAVAQVGFNVATLPFQAAKFAASGGFTNGVSEAYAKGAANGADKATATKAETSSPSGNKSVLPHSSAGSAGAGAAGSDAGGSSSSANGSGKSISITIGNLVGKIEIINSTEGIRNMQEQVKQALISVVNDAEIAI